MSQMAPQNRPSLSESLGQQLMAYIQAEQLGPGDRLPAVSKMAGQFSVATPTLREALRRLEATGMVEIRHGSGVYVSGNLGQAVLANPHYGQLDSTRIVDLLQARIIVEPPLAAMAARRVTPADLQELEGLLHSARRYLDGDDQSLHRANAAFHIGIARCSGNTTLLSVVDSFMRINTFEQLVILKVYDARSRDYDEHREIFEAIAGRDAPQAQLLMSRHLSEVLEVLKRKLGNEDPNSGGGRG
ncbi:FadR/GntR family transcriptional regulator [Deinococcus sp.]|uniref:FadR/GntR family transcriptional regulator n=1 Tax=Deinococcus sp. TaxID=47478 RepID=UPI003C7AB670